MQVIPQLHNFLHNLDPAGQERFNAMASTRKVPAGAAVYRQGDEPKEIYQIVQGAVRISSCSLDGRELVSTELRDGDCFGEMGVIDGMPRVSNAIASTTSTLRVLSRSNFQTLMTQYPEISHELMLTFSRRLRALYMLYEETGLSLHQRVARAIQRLAYTHSQRDEKGTVFIKLSQEDLARMLSASRQSVNREMRALREAGLVSFRYGRIYIENLEGLAAGYDELLGGEQIAPGYDESALKS